MLLLTDLCRPIAGLFGNRLAWIPSVLIPFLYFTKP